MQLYLHPRRWHLLTWSAFLLWLVFAVNQNIPRNFTFESFSELHDEPSNVSETLTTNSSTVDSSTYSSAEGNSTYSTTSRTTAISMHSSTIVIGWPFTYQEHTVTSTSRNVATTTHWFWLMENIVSLFIVQFCVAYSFQQFGQFSVRTMFLGTLVVALLILLGRFFSNAFWGWGLYYYICAIYFSPAIFAVLSISAKWYSQRRDRAEQRGADDAFDPTF